MTPAHDARAPLEVGDVLEGIGVQQDQIGTLAHRDGSSLSIHAQEAGDGEGPRVQHLGRRHPRSNHGGQLVKQGEPGNAEDLWGICPHEAGDAKPVVATIRPETPTWAARRTRPLPCSFRFVMSHSPSCEPNVLMRTDRSEGVRSILTRTTVAFLVRVIVARHLPDSATRVSGSPSVEEDP